MTINVAVVGVGHIGIYHAEKYANLAQCNLAYVVDIDEDRGKKVAQKFSTRYLSSYKELVGKVSAVSIAVDTSKHLEIAKFLLQNNIHVLLEKPFTNCTAEATQLAEVATENNLILMAGYSEKFSPLWREVSKLIIDPVFIHSSRLSIPNNRCLDINVIQDLMSHDINIMQALIYNKIQSISVLASSFISNRLDFCSVKINFEENIYALLVASKVNHYNTRNFFIHQHSGDINIDFINKTATFSPNKGDNVIIQCNEYDNINHEINLFLNSIISGNPVAINDSSEAIKTLLTIKKIEEKVLVYE